MSRTPPYNGMAFQNRPASRRIGARTDILGTFVGCAQACCQGRSVIRGVKRTMRRTEAGKRGPMKKYLLTVELHGDETAKELAVHGSPEGLENLANILLRLVENTREGRFDHDHLMTDLWGGSELTSEPQSGESELIHHVKVYCWKGDEFQR